MTMPLTSDSLFSSTLTHRQTFKEGMTAELTPIHGEQSCDMQVIKNAFSFGLYPDSIIMLIV